MHEEDIFMGMNLLDICNWAGNISFYAGGSLGGKNKKCSLLICFICGLSTTFGGGALLRDIFTLNVTPAILGNPGEFMAVAVFGLLFLLAVSNDKIYALFEGNNKKPASMLVHKVLVVLDSCGILAFAILGFDKGIVNHSYFVAVSTGVYSAVGGGFLAIFIRNIFRHANFTDKKKQIIQEIRESIPYYVYGFTMTVTYSVFAVTGVIDLYKNAVIAVLIPIAIFLGLVSDKAMRG
jgi:uncharacterized membrane protein YeiH